MQTWNSHSPSETNAIGEFIYPLLEWPACVWLQGDLGAGKTSLCQAIIHAAGYREAITSPTYNLIQEYPVAEGTIFHMDLYRLEDPEELDYLGLDSLWGPRSLFLVEWPERGEGRLPPTTHTLRLARDAGEGGDGESRTISFFTHN